MNTAWIFVSISSSGFMYSCPAGTTGTTDTTVETDTTGTTEAVTRTGAGAIVAGAAIEVPNRPDSNKFCE
jgi:hypothetical protein